MRTIKFRAWDLINRRWCGYDLKGFVFTDRATKEQEIIEWCPKRDGKILMQFTGLKDKNGKEIYEGDVVTVKDLNHPTENPIEIGVIEFLDEELKFWVRLDETGGRSIYPDEQEIEVIGNIYEDPELL
jgi:uncharacterized phage protein (TIGR01671 family)